MKNNKVVSLISIIILVGILILFWGLSRKNTKIENANNVESNYVKVDSFNNQSELNGKYDNLDLKSAKINMPQSLISGELEIPELFVKSDNLCEDFFDLTEATFDIDKDLFNNSEFSNNTYPLGPAVTDECLYAAIGCTGFATVDFINNNYSLDEDKNVEVIDLNNYVDNEYSLINSKGKISEFVSFADKYFKKYTNLLKIDAVPTSVNIYENEDLGRYMMVRYQQRIGGVDLSNVLSAYDEEFNEHYNSWECGYICISGLEKEDVMCINIQGGALELNSSSKIDEIISLNQAADILNKKLAEYKEYTINSISIEYLLSYKGNKQSEGIEQSEYNHRDNASWAEYASFDYYAFEPYWTFYVDKTYKNEIVAYVNCRNGDVLFVNNQ